PFEDLPAFEVGQGDGAPAVDAENVEHGEGDIAVVSTESAVEAVEVLGTPRCEDQLAVEQGRATRERLDPSQVLDGLGDAPSSACPGPDVAVDLDEAAPTVELGLNRPA